MEPKRPRKRIPALTVSSIRELLARGEQVKKIAAMFGISNAAVSRIKNGSRHKRA